MDLKSFKQHLVTVTSIYARAKNIQDSIPIDRLYQDHQENQFRLTPSRLIEMMDRAETARKLYAKALNMCDMLVLKVPDPTETEKLRRLCSMGLKSIDDTLTDLNWLGRRWSLHNSTKPKNPEPVTQRSWEDSNAASDNPFGQAPKTEKLDADSLRRDLKNSLKALLNLVDHLEPSDLVRLHKQLHKITNY